MGSSIKQEGESQNTRKLKDQIRLAKEFCKAHKLYGAESYIQGFSGYVLEILIVQYGSFVKLLQASARWTKKKVIDVEDHYPKKDALFHLNQSKTISPIVVVDPVDKLRNAAAALSEEKISLFKEIAKKYLVEPSETFFEKVILTADTVVEKAQKLKGHAVVIKVEPVEGKEDVVGAKLLKAYRFLSKQLDVFGMKEMDWQWEENAEFFFIIANDELPESELRIGPPTEMADACILFRQKHVDAFEQEGRLVANIAYPIRDLTGYVKDLLKAGYIKERVAKVIDFSTN